MPGPNAPLVPSCRAILDEIKLTGASANVQMGSSMVLYRADEYKKLELHRSIRVKTRMVLKNLEDLVKQGTPANVAHMSAEAKEEFFMDLAKAVRSADEFRLISPAATTARSMLEQYVEERMDSDTKRMLEEALRTKTLEQLQRVCDRCDDRGYRNKLTVKCKELLEDVLDCEAGLDIAIREVEVELLERALELCLCHAYNGPKVGEVRVLVEKVARAHQMIEVVKKELNHKRIKKTIDFCHSFGYNKGNVVAELEALYAKLLLIRAELEEGRSQANIKILNRALRACEKINYTCGLEETCRALAWRLKRIDEESSKAAESLDERHVRACVVAARELNIPEPSKRLQSLYELVDGPYDVFCEKMFKLAKKREDHAQCVSIALRKRDNVLKKKGEGKLELATYPRLKTADEWAAEKFFSFSRVELAANFLNFTTDDIHKPLLKLQCPANARNMLAWQQEAKITEMSEQIVSNFETVQKFMGQRPSSKITQRVDELVVDAFRDEQVRNHVFISVMKQCRANPLPLAVQAGWDLLAFCLTLFPPSPDFEDFLAAFLRKPENKAFCRKFPYCSLLEWRVYNEGEKRSPLTRMQIGTLLSGEGGTVQPNQDTFRAYMAPFVRRLKPRTGGVDGKKLPYADLLESHLNPGQPLHIEMPNAADAVDVFSSSDEEVEEKKKEKKPKKNKKDKKDKKDRDPAPLSPNTGAGPAAAPVAPKSSAPAPAAKSAVPAPPPGGPPAPPPPPSVGPGVPLGPGAPKAVSAPPKSAPTLSTEEVLSKDKEKKKKKKDKKER